MMRHLDGSGVVEHFVTPWSGLTADPAALYRDWSSEHRFAYVSLLRECIRIHSLDILHFHYGEPFAALALEAKDSMPGSSIRIAGTLHGTEVSAPSRDPGLPEAYRRCDLLTTVSRHHAALSRTVFGLDSAPVVIRNFCDLDELRRDAEPRSPRALERHRPRILYASNFRPIKNPLLAVEMFASMRARIDCELWLVGDGAMKPSVDSRIRDLGLQSDVRSFGLRRDIGRLISSSDLLLVSSTTESFCLVALEAMAVGVPVLAPSVGGLPELIEDDKNGFLYPLHAPERGIERVLRLLKDPERWDVVSRAASRTASEFDARSAVSDYEEAYAGLLSGEEAHRREVDVRRRL
jgi:N-acetyl-alpha-D-glucosaminyl L-malate synthase BshA